MIYNPVILQINPDYENLLPKMSDQRYAELKRSIQVEGQHYPIVVNENLQILDGHNRFRACIELEIEPDFVVRKFEDKLLEKKFVIESNLVRRHLNNFQLIELAVPLLEIEKELAKKRQINGGKIGRKIQLGLAPDDAPPKYKKGKATAAVAKKVGLSTRTFERGKKILAKATEEDKKKLRKGEKSISKVYNEVIAREKIKEEPIKTDINLQTSITTASYDERLALNNEKVLGILEDLHKRKVFCPLCENNMLECSKCHKKLQDFISKTKNERK
jgi:ParB-like chromosome segregation protein Spo0J